MTKTDSFQILDRIKEQAAKSVPLVQLVIKAPPCEQCSGTCCKSTSKWQYAVNLTRGEAKKDIFKAHLEKLKDHRISKYTISVLPYKDGKCPLLGDDDKCTVYDDRPKVCRKYKCTDRFAIYGDRSPFFRWNPDLVGLLRKIKTREPRRDL
jgi:hypothetical protein